MATITSFSPQTGIPGTLVTIQGSGFLGTSQPNGVVFGCVFNGGYWEEPINGAGIGNIVSLTDTEIQVRAPRINDGHIKIGGNFQDVLTVSPFTFLRPTINNFSPPGGVGGTAVTINGTNLGYSSTVLSGSDYSVGPLVVKIGGMVATVASANQTQIVATAPSKTPTQTPSTQKIYVDNGIYYDYSATDFVYPSPTVTSFSPATAAIGQQVTIYGTNLQYNPVVRIDYIGTSATYTLSSQGSVAFDPGGTWCTFLLPPAPVETFGINNGMKLNVFTDYHAEGTPFPKQVPGTLNYPAPTITQVTPLTGYNDGSVTLAIGGTNLHTISAVQIGSNVNPFNGFPPNIRTIDSYSAYGDSIVVNAFKGWYTDGPIKLYTGPAYPGYTLALTSSQIFDWTVPTITSWSPQSGDVGTVVTLYGKNFKSNGTTTVKFNGVPAASWGYGYPAGETDIPDRITATAPASTDGPIQIANDYGSTNTSTPFTYPPIPITVTRTSGPIGSGGGTISLFQYSKNGGAWTTMPTSMTIYTVDLMAYKARFTRASGYVNMDVQITVPLPANSLNDSTTSSPYTANTYGSFSRTTGYNVFFGVNSYGTPGGGGGPPH